MKIKSVVKPLLWTVLVIVAGLGIFQIVRLYNQPLGEALALPAASSGVQPAAARADAAGPVCGNTGKMVVLFTGADFTQGVWPLGADAVRLVQVDFDTQKIVVVAFPRDLVIQASGAAPENQGDQRLGLAYYYEQQATPGTDKDKITAGTQLVAKTLLDNFNARADHYLTLQLKSLEELFAAVGDVEINIPKAFVSDHGISFAKGKQALSPALAAEFVRTSEPDYDTGRLARQNLFLEAFQAKVVSAGIIPQVPALLEQFQQSITTDLSPRQLVDLACMLDKADQGKVKYYEITGKDLVTAGDHLALLPNVEAIKDFLDKKFKAE